MKKRLIIIFSVIIIGLIIIMVMPVKDETWSKGLINNYVLERKSEDSIILTKTNKKIVNEYIESYAISGDYIILRTISNEGSLDIIYYVIDSKKDKVYGSYNYEEFTEKQKELNIKKIKWIETINADK